MSEQSKAEKSPIDAGNRHNPFLNATETHTGDHSDSGLKKYEGDPANVPLSAVMGSTRSATEIPSSEYISDFPKHSQNAFMPHIKTSEG